MARPFLFCKVGAGNLASFWYDDWTNLGPLIELSGANGPRVTGIQSLAKVVQARQADSWTLPRGRHPIIVLLKACLPLVSTLSPNIADIFLWRNTNSTDPGQFSSALTWDKLNPVTGIASWWKSVWFPSSIPKHSFILWLTMRERLLTRDKLLRWGIQTPEDCLLCDSVQETCSHLFFLCPFSAQI